MEATFDQELDYAAGEAIFGLQLDKEQAVEFVLRNVTDFHVEPAQAERAIDAILSDYKLSL